MNPTSQSLVHVTRVEESINGEDEPQAHHEQSNNGESGSSSTQVEHVLVYRRVRLNNFVVGVSEKIVVSAALCQRQLKVLSIFRHPRKTISLHLW